MMGWVFDTVGWTGASAGAFELSIGPGSFIQAQLFDGSSWHNPTWYPPADFDWGPVDHEVGITWGPAGVGLIVDCVVRAVVPYTGGLDPSMPSFLGQAPWNEPYGPHTLVGTYRDLRVLAGQPDLAGVGQPTPPPQPTPFPTPTPDPGASVQPGQTPGAGASPGPTATDAPPGFADACIVKGGTFYRNVGGYGCILPDGSTIECTDWSTCRTGTADCVPGAAGGTTADVTDAVLLDTSDGGKLRLKPRAAPKFTLATPHVITAIETYHPNRGDGAVPGTLSLVAQDGTLCGPWTAVGRGGPDGTGDTYWLVEPDVSLPAGTHRHRFANRDLGPQHLDEGRGLRGRAGT